VGFLRSLGAWIVISGSTILCGLPAIPMGFVPPRGAWSMFFGRAWSRMILGGTGVRVRVIHPERFGRGESFVIAANHESFYDILVLFARLPMKISFLAKRNLFRLPILGWSMAAAGFVPVDRGQRRGAATVEAALKRAGRGASLIVFPEETRTRTGELLPFKAGAALLAIRSGLPILPIGIGGTFGILRRGGFTVTPSEVAIAVGEPMPVAGLSGRERGELTERLRERIEALRAEARAAVAYNPDAEKK
jgi:1-acyl-sn-glycerol-3-phosphate acyltransferase